MLRYPDPPLGRLRLRAAAVRPAGRRGRTSPRSTHPSSCGALGELPHHERPPQARVRMHVRGRARSRPDARPDDRRSRRRQLSPAPSWLMGAWRPRRASSPTSFAPEALGTAGARTRGAPGARSASGHSPSSVWNGLQLRIDPENEGVCRTPVALRAGYKREGNASFRVCRARSRRADVVMYSRLPGDPPVGFMSKQPSRLLDRRRRPGASGARPRRRRELPRATGVRPHLPRQGRVAAARR